MTISRKAPKYLKSHACSISSFQFYDQRSSTTIFDPMGKFISRSVFHRAVADWQPVRGTQINVIKRRLLSDNPYLTFGELADIN